jgi:hypothetical protein
VIVRGGLDGLPALLAEVGSERPVVVSSERWSGVPLPVGRCWHGARAHTPADTVADALAAAAGRGRFVAHCGGSAEPAARDGGRGRGALPEHPVTIRPRNRTD